jgi:hypothetical protein
MKKIILSIIISSLSLSAFAVGVFNVQIPQPDFVSNDWDGDGKANSVDEDDDGDGILDDNDSTPFGQPGGNSEVSSGITSFTSNQAEIFIGGTVNLSWNIDGSSNLSLFGGTFDQITGFDVTSLSTKTDTPTSLTTYTLYSDTGSSSVFVDVLPVPIVNSFTLNGSSSNITINTGDNVNILWNVNGGKNISITDGDTFNNTNLSDSGTITDTPDSSVSYTLFDGLNESTLNVNVINNCSFSISYSSTYYSSWTGVYKLGNGQYRFVKNGSNLASDTSATSIPGYYVGSYKGQVKDHTPYTADLTKVYELCEI